MAGQGTPAVIADQEPGRPGGRTSILTRQRADHAGLDRLINRAWVNRERGGTAYMMILPASRQSGRSADTLPSRTVMLSVATHRRPHPQR
jgi:hypothetical protein